MIEAALLRTDDQTIEDLGIFGKHKGPGVYDLYNRLHTKGGETILEEMFRHPLADKEAINRRIGIVSGLAGLQLTFPYSASLLDMAEKYTSHSQESEKSKSGSAALGEREIQNGVQAVIELIRLTKAFVERDSIKGINEYTPERQAIGLLLADPALEPALKDMTRAKLSYAAVTAYDGLFRVSERRKIRALMEHIYRLDVYMSVARTAVERGFIFPKALDKGACELRLEGVYHPVLKQPIGNDIAMDAAQNVIFLTGANMAGKSTFLRALSTALYLAHMGFPVAASSMEFSVLDGLYTTVNLPDNLGIGASHFYAEVLRVKKMATELSTGKSFFILFDELFRGTNVKDAREATVAVVQGFSSRRNSLFIISSHIVEAGEELRVNDHIGFRRLPTRMKGHLPEYTYRLEQGITDDRHGMIIIRNEGILDVLREGRKTIDHSSFTTDKQTIEELNLLGKFRQGSVYGLFNRVKTRGGEQLLESMFRQPLKDAAAINERSAIFQFFQQAALSFPFDVQQITLMREYLDVTAPKNAALALAGTLLEKGLSSLARDERYKKNMQGLQATIVTLHKCYGFVQSFGLMACPYNRRLDEVRQILANRHLEKLGQIDIYRALSVRTLAYYNHLLRNKLYREMETLLSFFYEVDLNIAVSDAARGKGFSYAQAQPAEKDLFSAVDLHHPCIDKAVGNTLSLSSDSNVLFLTGANMAGKSTLMKSVGIGIYLAHMGFPVAATGMTFSVREGLYSSINVADNIGLGYSHFYAEVVRVKQAAEAAASGKKLVLMFDELFKGTNVKDAYDGTLAVTEAFADYRDCLFIVSTHIIEVAEALAGLSNIRRAYMPTVMEGSRPRYSYRMQEGVTEDRQGMMIIKNEGILELLNNKK